MCGFLPQGPTGHESRSSVSAGYFDLLPEMFEVSPGAEKHPWQLRSLAQSIAENLKLRIVLFVVDIGGEFGLEYV